MIPSDLPPEDELNPHRVDQPGPEFGVADLRGGYEGPLRAFLATAVDSIHTRRAYQRHVREAFRMMGCARVADLSPNGLVMYRAVLLEDGRGQATHAQALSAVRSFLNWCDALGGLPMPARTMEVILRVPQVTVVQPFVIASAPEIQALIEGASLRDRALILVMVGAGLRVGEVEHLDCSDLLEVEGGPAIWVREGKGKKDRIVPIEEEVKVAIHRYLIEDNRQVGIKGEPLFLAQDRGVDSVTRATPRLSDDGIRKILRRLVLKATVAKRITPHALRHTFGMAFQRNGRDLNLTAKVLGHATVAPTLRYTDHLELEELRGHLPQWTATKKPESE